MVAKPLAAFPCQTNDVRARILAVTNQLSKSLVDEQSKSNPTSTRLSILLVALGLCVFFWGLGYKLSLYDLHEPSIHRVPEAKLLSRNEDPNATDGLQHCLAKLMVLDPTSSGSVLFIFLLGNLARLQSNSTKLRFAAAKTLHPRSAPIVGAFFLRPPPAISEF
jgi:hypothetical protein